MGDYLIPFLIVIILLAAFMRQDFLLTLAYILIGAFLASRAWGRRAMRSVAYARTFPSRAFLGEAVEVDLELRNSGWLPVVWLHARESLPPELAFPPVFQQVVSLPPHGKVHLRYLLEGRKRGYYRIGPLNLYSSDLLGADEKVWNVGQADYLIVYPRIIPLAKVALPSRSPLGTLRHTQPIYEDPSRPRGKRDYVSGDSLRRVDWKASAAAGRLQVKLFEPSIALETAIFLDMNAGDYGLPARFDDPELAVIVAASLANWITSRRQAVGLYTNGIDPLAPEISPPHPVPAHRGRAHLMRVLDVLARVQAAETYPLVHLLQRESVNLSWGTTLILITRRFDEVFFDSLFGARRSGLDAVLIAIGYGPDDRDIRQRAMAFGFPYFRIEGERDLDLWRH
jgi:uncharacterized protein (DUF58 family)